MICHKIVNNRCENTNCPHAIPHELTEECGGYCGYILGDCECEADDEEKWRR